MESVGTSNLEGLNFGRKSNPTTRVLVWFFFVLELWKVLLMAKQSMFQETKREIPICFSLKLLLRVLDFSLKWLEWSLRRWHDHSAEDAVKVWEFDVICQFEGKLLVPYFEEDWGHLEYFQSFNCNSPSAITIIEQVIYKLYWNTKYLKLCWFLKSVTGSTNSICNFFY